MSRLRDTMTSVQRATTFAHMLFFSGVGLVLVVSALILEHGFGAAPCHLCWLQRYGHWAILGIALAGLSLPYRGRLIALWGIFFAAFYGFVLGVYHSLVQAKYLPAPTGCSGSEANLDMEALEAFLKNPTLPPRCDEVSFAVFGFSLPVWNIMIMTVLMFIAYDILRRHRLAKGNED